MSKASFTTALIVGAGHGLSNSLARRLAADGLKVGLAARNAGKLQALAEEIGGVALACDASNPSQVVDLFDDVAREVGDPDVVIYNAGWRGAGPFGEIRPEDVERSLAVNAFGGFLVSQQAALRMSPRRHGAILLTGASASVKGYARSAPFAMGKFALRGLAQSMARELAPQGIHVAHFVIDGAIRAPGRSDPEDRPDSLLDPEAIAETYLAVLRQPRSAWTWEVEIRPWVETF